mgnify:CR=1 FL=1
MHQEFTNFSFWEARTLFKQSDLAIIGAGIVGLSTAISFKKKHPLARVVVFERGWMQDGASTKNAGFACFGSVGELCDDLTSMPSETVFETLAMRWQGLKTLRKRLGDKNLRFEKHGGFELFDNEVQLDAYRGQLDMLNRKVKEYTGQRKCFSVVNNPIRHFGSSKHAFFNCYEGQLDTGLMMQNLRWLAMSLKIELFFNTPVTALESLVGKVSIATTHGEFFARNVVVATNGFAARLLNIKDVRPARAQVLVTKPIHGLQLKGTFHYQKGYYYFRNIDGRILLGGGRNLDFEGETTYAQGISEPIQNELNRLLGERIVKGRRVEVERRWSGIMGVGSEKKPIIKAYRRNIIAAVRMGGMGVAIGTLVGEKAAGMVK